MANQFVLLQWVLFLPLSTAWSQALTDRCTVVHRENTQQFETWLTAKQEATISTTSDIVYRLPVVVHILHNGEPVGEGTIVVNLRDK